jgi:hypothetical protein
MPPVTVKVLHVEKVQVTAENELEILRGEYERRYDDRDFCEGDDVEFIREGRQRHADAFGANYVGKRAVVTALSENGEDVKVLAITADGSFGEFWTPEACLVRIKA